MPNRLFLLPVLAGFATLAQAAETQPTDSHIWLLPAPQPSTLRFELGTDSEAGGGQRVDADLAMGRSARLRFGAVGGADGDGAARDTHQWLLGLSSDPLERFEVGINSEEWGRTDEYIIRSNSLYLQVNGRNWSLAIEPGERQVEAIDGAFRAEFDGGSLGLRADWQPDGMPRIDFAAVAYDYDRDPTTLDAALQPRLREFLSPRAIALPRRLEDWHARFALTWDSSQLPLGLEYQSSRSAVDDSQASSIGLSVRLLLGKLTTMRLGFGQQVIEDSESLTYSTLALDFNW